MNLLHDDVQKCHAQETADDGTCVGGVIKCLFILNINLTQYSLLS